MSEEAVPRAAIGVCHKDGTTDTVTHLVTDLGDGTALVSHARILSASESPLYDHERAIVRLHAEVAGLRQSLATGRRLLGSLLTGCDVSEVIEEAWEFVDGREKQGGENRGSD